MDYNKWLIKQIGKIVSENDCEFIMYPFGTRGIMAKSILNLRYGINEKLIIDNVLCETYKSVENLEYLKQIDLTNCKILITSDNEEIYEEIREELYAVVEKSRCIELFNVPDIVEAKRKRPEVLEKMKQKGIAPIYHPQKTKSIFYLPFLPMDSLQRAIFLDEDYYERPHLDYVFKVHRNGVIGKEISEGKGVVLDIGANIGNHTLFFCNEYNAKKVYCFEPVEQTFFILAENIKLNHLEDKVILNSFALGEKEERASVVKYNLANIGGTGLRQDRNGDLKIRRLDGLGIEEPIKLIKIDVEGMELSVIKGGMELIKKNRPYMMVESTEEDSFPEVKQILCGIGYSYKRMGVMDWFFYFE